MILYVVLQIVVSKTQGVIVEPGFSILLTIITAICWGANAHLVRLGMRGENHFHGLFVRSFFAFPILYGIVLVWKGFHGLFIYTHNPVLFYAICSSTLVLTGDSLFLIGLKKYSVNVMAPITATYPIFVSFILIITKQEQIGTLILLGTVVVIIGVAIVTSNDITETFDKNAIFIGMITSICWGTSIVFVRLALETDGTDSLGLTGVRMTFIGFAALIIYQVGTKTGKIENSGETRDKNSLKFMAASGIVSWVIGASLFFAAVQRIGAAIPTPISSTNPIIAALIGQVLGIEALNAKQFGGIILSVVGIVLIVLA